jgi:hypothetical protein
VTWKETPPPKLNCAREKISSTENMLNKPTKSDVRKHLEPIKKSTVQTVFFWVVNLKILFGRQKILI